MLTKISADPKAKIVRIRFQRKETFTVLKKRPNKEREMELLYGI